MKIHYCLYAILLQLLSVFTVLHCELVSEAKECETWRQIEKNLEASNDGRHIQCVILSSCTGLNCTGTFQSYEFNASLQIKPCNNPISVNIVVDIPKLGIHQGSYSISSNETIATPDLELPVIGKVGAYLDATYRQVDNFVHFRLTARQKPVEGIMLMPPVDIIHDLQIPIPSCKEGKPVTHMPGGFNSTKTTSNQAIGTISENLPAVASSTTTSVTCQGACGTQQKGKTCEIGNLTSCGQHETCVQESIKSLKGHCECVGGFQQDVNGMCVQVSGGSEITMPTTGNMPGQSAAKKDDTAKPNTQSNSTKMAVIGVLVPLAFVTLTGAIVYFILRRLHLQRESLAQDHPLIGQNEEGDGSDSVI